MICIHEANESLRERSQHSALGFRPHAVVGVPACTEDMLIHTSHAGHQQLQPNLKLVLYARQANAHAVVGVPACTGDMLIHTSQAGHQQLCKN